MSATLCPGRAKGLRAAAHAAGARAAEAAVPGAEVAARFGKNNRMPRSKGTGSMPSLPLAGSPYFWTAPRLGSKDRLTPIL